jgi:hypothetical protein
MLWHSLKPNRLTPSNITRNSWCIDFTTATQWHTIKTWILVVSTALNSKKHKIKGVFKNTSVVILHWLQRPTLGKGSSDRASPLTIFIKRRKSMTADLGSGPSYPYNGINLQREKPSSRKDTVWFQVSMNYILGMKITEKNEEKKTNLQLNIPKQSLFFLNKKMTTFQVRIKSTTWRNKTVEPSSWGMYKLYSRIHCYESRI